MRNFTLRKAFSLLALFSVAALAACNSGNATPPPMPTASQSKGGAVQSRAAQAHSKASAGTYSLFGDAVLVNPGENSPTAVQESSDATTYGGIDFGLPAGTTFSQITNLAADYKFTTGTCGSGSPRFSVFVDNGVHSGNINFYIGPPPNFTGCPPNVWTSSGNLATAANVWVDDTQLPGGAFYDSYAAAQAKYGSYSVTDISLVDDSGWAGTQVVLFDNIHVNSTTYTFETKDSCKNGGWQQFTTAPGPFKNQGDCVSYFNNGK